MCFSRRMNVPGIYYIKHLMSMKGCLPMEYISVKLCPKCTSLEKSPEHALTFAWKKAQTQGELKSEMSFDRQ